MLPSGEVANRAVFEEIRALPKVELHMHLDCGLSFDFVRSREPDISRERFHNEFVAPVYSPDFAPYLRCANRAVALLQSEEALQQSVFDLFRQLEDDNVVYGEIRFAPLLHLDGGLRPRDVVAAVDASVRAASSQTGIAAGVLLCTLRHYDEAQSLETARLVKDFAGSSVVGLDLAGDEAGYPIAPHVAAYDFARVEGLARTAHAGEALGPESIRETLAMFEPSRLGHGVRCSEDPLLVRELRARDIHLEVCVTSNVQTGVCSSFAEHPLAQLHHAGLSLGISTDARTISNVTLSDEYERIAEVFGWSADDFRASNRAALDAAFAEPDVKARVREKLR